MRWANWLSQDGGMTGFFMLFYIVQMPYTEHTSPFVIRKAHYHSVTENSYY